MDNKLKVFGAGWCSSCKQLKAELEKVNISFDYIDIDINPELAKEFNIRSLPTSIINEKRITGNKLLTIMEALND
jgi:thioredoxin-like negative regulator of GroEL